MFICNSDSVQWGKVTKYQADKTTWSMLFWAVGDNLESKVVDLRHHARALVSFFIICSCSTPAPTCGLWLSPMEQGGDLLSSLPNLSRCSLKGVLRRVTRSEPRHQTLSTAYILCVHILIQPSPASWPTELLSFINMSLHPFPFHFPNAICFSS